MALQEHAAKCSLGSKAGALNDTCAAALNDTRAAFTTVFIVIVSDAASATIKIVSTSIFRSCCLANAEVVLLTLVVRTCLHKLGLFEAIKHGSARRQHAAVYSSIYVLYVLQQMCQVVLLGLLFSLSRCSLSTFMLVVTIKCLMQACHYHTLPGFLPLWLLYLLKESGPPVVGSVIPFSMI